MPLARRTSLLWPADDLQSCPELVEGRYNRWSQRGIRQRLFEKVAAAGPVPKAYDADSLRNWLAERRIAIGLAVEEQVQRVVSRMLDAMLAQHGGAARQEATATA